MNRARVGLGGAQHIIEQLVERNRPFRARELAQYGVTRAWLPMVFFPMVERLACGVWGRRGARFPRVVISATRTDGSIACLSSALWLHGLLPHEPAQAWLCIGNKARKPGARASPNTQFIRTNRWPGPGDVCVLNPWRVRTTSIPRTLVDFFRFQRRIGSEAAHAALEVVLKAGACTLAEIDACADRYGLRYWRRLDS